MDYIVLMEFLRRVSEEIGHLYTSYFEILLYKQKKCYQSNLCITLILPRKEATTSKFSTCIQNKFLMHHLNEKNHLMGIR